MLKSEATDIKSFPVLFDFGCIDEIRGIYNTLKNREAIDTFSEIDTNEHKQIDRIVFDHLGIGSSDGLHIIDTLKNMIVKRIVKAKT